MAYKSGSGSINRREFIKISSLVGGGLLLGACAPVASNTGTSGGTGSAPKTMMQAKGATPSFSMAQTSPIYVGEARGFFKEEGIQTEWTEFSGGGDEVRAVVSGGFTYSTPSVSASISAFAQGQNLKVIAGGYWGPIIGWMVPKDSPIKTTQDLKGKKISYSRPGSWSNMVAMLVAKNLGLTPEQDIKLVSTGGIPDSWAAAKGGVVDAAWSSPPVMEKVIASGEGRLLFWSYDLVKNAQEQSIIVTDSMIKEKPDVIRAFMKGYQRTLDWMTSSDAALEEAAKVWHQYLSGLKIEYDQQIIIQSYKDIPKNHWNLGLNKEALLNLESMMMDFKVIDKKVDWKNLVDQQFLPEKQRVTF